jgi:hypothetical protein
VGADERPRHDPEAGREGDAEEELELGEPLGEFHLVWIEGIEVVDLGHGRLFTGYLLGTKGL